MSRHLPIVILSVNPELIEGSALKAIEAETIDVYGKQLQKSVQLPEIEMKILSFVNEKNVSNSLVSFKDITMNFSITKPTTRAKLRRLAALGLLSVEKRGRHKSLKITSAGRRIIQ